VWQISIMIPPATHTEKDDVFFFWLLVDSGVVFVFNNIEWRG